MTPTLCEVIDRETSCSTLETSRATAAFRCACCASTTRSDCCDPRTSMSTAASFDLESIGPVIQPLYEELCARLDRAGPAPTGPGIAYYEDAPDGDGVLVHASVPVNADPSN